jgi:hypothetical protein
MFLQALSTGVTSIEEENNTGAAIRLDFGIPDENRYGVTAAWSGEGATPLDDIENVIAKARAKGHVITRIMMDRTAFNSFRKHAQVKELYAAGLNFAGANIPTPNFTQVNDALRDNYSVTIEIVDRSVSYEKNGVTVSVNPWDANAVVFLTSEQVGSLVWSRLAEMNHKAKQVDYAVADEFKLISKYHKVDPLREFTSGQAIAIPVLDNPEAIYIMNYNEATASLDVQTEGDAVYTYNGTDYTKQSVVDGLNATEEVPTSLITHADSTLAKKIDKLSEEGVATFEAELVEAGV